MSDQRLEGGGDLRPIPDPTKETLARLEREVAGLRDLMEAKLTGHTELANEKFARIESLRKEQKEDTERAVSHALASLKEVIGELKAGFDTEITALQRRVDENKDRIVDVDRKVNGTVQQSIGAKEDRSGLYAALAAVAVVITIVVAVVNMTT